jgi:pyruvate carboxylase
MHSLAYFCTGYLGIPPCGFPEPLRSKIVRSLPKIAGRPGASMAPFDFAKLRTDLDGKYGGGIRDVDLSSAALYPAVLTLWFVFVTHSIIKVFQEYQSMVDKYGDLSILPTRFFLSPLKIGEEIHVAIEPGKTLIIKLLAVGQSNPTTGTKDVFFQLNGESRVISISDQTSGKNSGRFVFIILAVEHTTRQKANANNPGEVGAPMSGIVVEVRVKAGHDVKTGDPLCVLSAMKMETVVSSPVSGKIEEILVKEADSLNAGDLICRIVKQ